MEASSSQGLESKQNRGITFDITERSFTQLCVSARNSSFRKGDHAKRNNEWAQKEWPHFHGVN